MKKHPPELRRKAIRSYRRGNASIATVARKYGISSSTLQLWLNPTGAAKRWGADEVALTGGAWVFCPRTRVQRWQPANELDTNHNQENPNAA